MRKAGWTILRASAVCIPAAAFLMPGFGAMIVCMFVLAGILSAAAVEEMRNRRRIWMGAAAAVLLWALPAASYLGFVYGPTFGRQIAFSRTLWSSGINDNLRYHMSQSIERETEGKSREEVTALLGAPDGSAGNGSSVSYFLRSESFIMGLKYAELVLSFEQGRCVNAEVVHPD